MTDPAAPPPVDVEAIRQRQEARQKCVRRWSEPDEGGRNVPTKVWRDAAEEVAHEAEADVTALLGEADRLQQERDHECHEKETVADAAKAHSDWLRRKLEQAEAQVAALRAQIQRVQEAARYWRGMAPALSIKVKADALVRCADELEAALAEGAAGTEGGDDGTRST